MVTLNRKLRLLILLALHLPALTIIDICVLFLFSSNKRYKEEEITYPMQFIF